MTQPAVAVLPYGHRLGPKLAQLPLSDLDWPLGQPDRLRQGTVADLTAQDHLIVFPKTAMHWTLRWGTRAKVSLIMGEPAVIHARHHQLLRLSHRRFHRVLTFNQDLLDRLPNARLLPYGTTWVPDWQTLDTTKTAMCSLIASAKRDTRGHQLRHQIVDWISRTGQDVQVMGGGYQPFDRKSDGLAPFRYSVVIENMPERNYFSEKLVDAVLCGCVPIYWGCPNLRDFFDPAGIIQCHSAKDLQTAIAQMSADQYTQQLPALEALQPKIAAYADWQGRAARLLLSEP